MQKNQIDEGLNFKKRARRRLVGAVALVFLMIIILPMILEDREESLAQDDVEIIMPNQDGAELTDPEGIALNETVEVLPDDAVTAQVIDLPKVKTPAVKPEPKVEAKVAPKPKTEPIKVVKPVEVKKAPVKKEVAKKAADAKVAVKKTVNKPVGASDKYYVQIGVFSELGNVKKLQTKLNDLGYQSVTENITTDKGVKTRLRTETFVGRNEAAIALENIKDSGLTGMVVNQK